MNKHFSKALSMILCLMMILAQFPVSAHAHEHDHAHSGLVLSVEDGAVTLTHDEAELAHWPLSEGVTPSLGIGTVDGSFALLMQLGEPHLVLFQAFTPDALTLCGAFDRLTVDSGLETALTLCADEHSSIAHAELLGTVTLENEGTLEKLSAVETAIVSGSNLPENSLTAENSEAAIEAAQTAEKHHDFERSHGVFAKKRKGEQERNALAMRFIFWTAAVRKDCSYMLRIPSMRA